MAPMAGTATPPIPDEPPGNWFNHYWENLWIVQVFDCKMVLKEQTRDGKVTQVDWVVRIPKNHGHRKLEVRQHHNHCSPFGSAVYQLASVVFVAVSSLYEC